MGESNSLERMLAVLDLFTENHLEWTSEEMMDRLGYSRPTLYRYLRTLRQHGLLAGMNNAVFTLGPKVVEMDFLLRRSDPLALEGKPILEELAKTYPCTAFVSRWYRTRVLCIESVRSAATPKSSYPRGRPMPIGRGATARAILAHLPNRQLEPLIKERLEEFREVGFGQSKDEVLAGLKLIRKRGAAVARGEVTEGVCGISSPVFDAGRAPIASLSVTIAEEEARSNVVEAIISDVREAAAKLSDQLAKHRAPSKL